MKEDNKMYNNVLTIKQIKRLDSIGIYTKNGSMIYDYEPISDIEDECYNLICHEQDKECNIYYDIRSIPTYTIQDIFERLPKNIDNFSLSCDFKRTIGYYNTSCVNNDIVIDTLVEFKSRNMLDSAFELLIWVKTNYNKTNLSNNIL